MGERNSSFYSKNVTPDPEHRNIIHNEGNEVYQSMSKGNSLVFQNTYRGASKTNSASWAIFSSGTLVRKIEITVFNNHLSKGSYQLQFNISERMLTIYHQKHHYTFALLIKWSFNHKIKDVSYDAKSCHMSKTTVSFQNSEMEGTGKH